jgi:FtsH ternary system domain X6
MSIAVTRAEANLLTIARVAVGVVPAMDAMRLLVTSVTPPAKLGPTARAALADTLSRGSVLSLAKQGGWLAEGKQRLWERHPAPPPLEFTGNTVRLLGWVLASPLAEVDSSPLIFKGPITLAEDSLIALLIDRLRGTGCEGALVQQLSVRKLPLTTLAHAAFMAREVSLDEVPEFDVVAIAPWVEGLRTLFARSWLSAERAKRDLTAPDMITRIGRAQSDVLDAFFKAIHAAGRHDLATFLIDAASTWVTPDRTADEFTRSMQMDAPLRDRTEARRRAAAMLRGLSTLREWDQEHRAVRFIDDGYALAQRLVADWERVGERGFSKAAQLVSELDAIPTLRPAEP